MWAPYWAHINSNFAYFIYGDVWLKVVACGFEGNLLEDGESLS